MPERSKIRRLPDEVRRQLDSRLVGNGFGGYSELSGWLADQGYEIGKSSIHRYGSDLEERIERIRLATEQAEALVEASGDESGAMSDASIRLIQERMFDVLLTSQEGDVKALSSAARALADTARAGTTVRQERRRALREAADEAAKSAGEEARKAGLTLPPEALRRIREQVYGIYDSP